MGTLISLTGPSASGKSTIERNLEERGFTRLVSFTTRPMRKGEKNHVDYHFLTRHEAMKFIDAGDVLQHVEFNDHIYGTLISDLEFLRDPGAKGVVVVEPNGVNNIRAAIKKYEMDFVDLKAVYVKISRLRAYERMVERFLTDEIMTKEVFDSRWRSLTEVEIVMWPLLAQYDAYFRNEDETDLMNLLHTIGVTWELERLEKKEAPLGA